MEMIETFPDDENGDVLRQMQESGDDLSRPREIDFSVVFPGELEAQTMATQFRELGFAVDVEASGRGAQSAVGCRDHQIHGAEP